MKKIVLISVSVLALGAASIAADADGVSLLPNATGFATSSLATPASKAVAQTNHRGARISENAIERSVRLVSSNIAPVNSCDAAYWPYYPAECLKRAETADL